MSGLVPASLACAALLLLVATEILRSVVHRRRERRDGIAGTQHLAQAGTFIGSVLVLAALATALLWALQT